MHRKQTRPNHYYSDLVLDMKNEIDYMTSSNIHWHIHREHLYAVNKLDVFDHVTSLLIEWRGFADPAVLSALAQKLPMNSSVNRISICNWHSHHNESRWEHEPIQVRLDIVDGLINVMGALTTRHHPLIQLDIELPFHPSLHQRLVELLTFHTSLKHLSLEMIHMPAEVFKTIINILMTSYKSLKTLKFANVTNITGEIVELIVETVKLLNLKKLYLGQNVTENDSRLKELETQGYSVDIYGKNETKYVDIYRKKDYFCPTNPPKPIFPTITNDEHQTNMIQTLPTDILQYILNELDITSLLRFKDTNKQIQSWFQSSTFWRQYSLSKASTITTDTLTAADLIYGSYIDRNRNVNFWQCISMAFTGSCLRRDVFSLRLVAECYSMNAFHKQLIQKLVHTYPELRMMESDFCHMTSDGKWHDLSFGSRKLQRSSKMNFFPLRMAFYVYASSGVKYHLNVDITRPDAVGIIFYLSKHNETERPWNASPRAIFDYFVSSSIDEVIGKVKPMVEAMTVSIRTSGSFTGRSLWIQKIIDCDAIPEVHKKCVDSFTNIFDTYSKALLNELQLTYNHYEAFKNVIEQFNNHVSNVTIDHVIPDYAVIHHRIDQKACSQLYQVSSYCRVSYWYFEYCTDHDINESYTRRLKQVKRLPRTNIKREKKTPYVALICLCRKVLNLIMMPVLKHIGSEISTILTLHGTFMIKITGGRTLHWSRGTIIITQNGNHFHRSVYRMLIPRHGQ